MISIRHTFSRRLRHEGGALLLAALVLGQGACHDSSGPGLPRPVAGHRFVLVSRDGNPIPAVYYESATLRLEIVAETLAFTPDGSFTSKGQTRWTYSGQAPYLLESAYSGWYSQAAGSLALSYNGVGSSATGTVSGPRIEIVGGAPDAFAVASSLSPEPVVHTHRYRLLD